jgi:hypothetical protein
MIRLVVELPSLATEIRAAGPKWAMLGVDISLSQSKQERKGWRERGE